MPKKGKSRKGGTMGIKKYTAFVPKTLKATANLGRKTLRGLNSIVTKATNMVRKTTKAIDKTTAKAIRSVTKKRGRK